MDKVIFIDTIYNIAKPYEIKFMNKVCKAVNKMHMKDPDINIVLVGCKSQDSNINVLLPHLPKNVLKSNYICDTTGTEILTWISHNPCKHICIVSHNKDIRPFEDYRLETHRFFLHSIKKILSKEYVSHKDLLELSKNNRKMF